MMTALQAPLTPALINHQAEALLLALQSSGHTALLLHERHDRLTEQIQQLLLLDPAHAWQASDVAQCPTPGHASVMLMVNLCYKSINP